MKRMRCSGNRDYILQKPFATRTPSTTPWSPSLPEGGLDYTSPPSHKQTTFIRRGGVSPPVINTNRRKTAGAEGFPNANTVSIWGSEQTPALRQKSNVHLYNRNKQIAVGGDVPDAPYKTITANLTSISETNISYASLREGGGTRSVTEGVCVTNVYRKPHLCKTRKPFG